MLGNTKAYEKIFVFMTDIPQNRDSGIKLAQ